MNSPADGKPPRVSGSDTNSNLKRDILKQAVASLAAAIGSIRYADDVHISASDKVSIDTSEIAPQQPKAALGAGSDEGHGVSQIFSVQQMSVAAQHANEICTQYGVSIVSINVISA